jgi:hypothetical protein
MHECLSERRIHAGVIRASTINPNQMAIRIKIIYYCSVGGERGEERIGVRSNEKASSSTYS